MATVESPSHWRYFENKKKMKLGEHSINFDRVEGGIPKLSPVRNMKKQDLDFLDKDYSHRMILKQAEKEKERVRILK